MWFDEIVNLPKVIAAFIITKKKINQCMLTFKHSFYPAYGQFFEYKMCPKEFLKEVSCSVLKSLNND